MKRLLFLFIVSAFVLGCKSNPATKLDMKSEVKLKGNWVLSKVAYPGSDYIKVTSFNTADAQCFVGSKWKFVSNNNTGEMALTDPSCVSYSSQIKWFINKEGNIVIKFLTEGVKAKHTTSGYVLRVANQTENSFQLLDKVNVGGNTSDIVYQFDRTN